MKFGRYQILKSFKSNIFVYEAALPKLNLLT